MYNNPTLKKEDLIERLLDLDYQVYNQYIHLYNSKPNQKIVISIAGSSSLILNHVSIQVTEDIDIFEIYDFTEKLISDYLLDKYDMNTHILTYMESLPYNCPDRTVLLDLDTYIINYRLLSVEDAIIGKIAADREKDHDHLNIILKDYPIDWNKLYSYALEMKDSSITLESYRWFVSRFNRFVEENKHEEIIIKNI